jgi:hypothetical protein
MLRIKPNVRRLVPAYFINSFLLEGEGELWFNVSGSFCSSFPEHLALTALTMHRSYGSDEPHLLRVREGRTFKARKRRIIATTSSSSADIDAISATTWSGIATSDIDYPGSDSIQQQPSLPRYTYLGKCIDYAGRPLLS